MKHPRLEHPHKGDRECLQRAPSRGEVPWWTSLCAVLLVAMVSLQPLTACSMNTPRGGHETRPLWHCDQEGDEAMKAQDYEAAIRLHERFLEKEDRNPLALYHLGYAYGQRGDHQQEVLLYEEALSLGYTEPSVFFNLGMAYAELRRPEEAVRAFQRGLELHPRSADNYLGLGMVYQRGGSRDELAEKAFLKALEIDPGLKEARLYLSLLYVDMGELRKAADQLRTVLDLNPVDPMARELLEKIEKE